jgi:septum formation protein
MPGGEAGASALTDPQPKLVLASTSIYRRALLERLGVPFRARAPLCDEESFKGKGQQDPRALAETLARAKAASLVRVEPDATIIGCDQVVSFQGQVFGKPESFARAVEQLVAMAGQTHELVTALVVLHGGRVYRHTDATFLRMRSLSRSAIERYVDADRPFDCAGAYKLEARGIALFGKIESDDHTAITGLPLIALVTTLRELGYDVP